MKATKNNHGINITVVLLFFRLLGPVCSFMSDVFIDAHDILSHDVYPIGNSSPFAA